MKKKLIIAAVTTAIFSASCSISNINSKPNTSSASTVPDKKIIKESISKKPDNNPINNLNADESKLSNTKRAWYFTPHTDGTPSSEPQDVLNLINKYSAYYLGDTSKRFYI